MDELPATYELYLAQINQLQANRQARLINRRNDPLYNNKKKLRSAIKKATEKCDELTKLEVRASTSFLEAKKPVFHDCEHQHPLNFLDKLNTYLKQVPEEEQSNAAYECLDSSAKDWAGAFMEPSSGYHCTLDAFKKAFISKYWGDAARNSLRRKIVGGVYGVEDESMSTYFINLISQARWLPNQIPDEELIADIMNHFPKDVQIGWNSSQKSTVLEAVEYLRKLDEIEMLSDLKENQQNMNINCKYRVRVKENVASGSKTTGGDLVNYEPVNKKMRTDL